MTRERNSTLVVSNRMGARNDGMSNISELLVNAVMRNKPKILIRLDQKVRGMDRVFRFHSTQSSTPPADRQTLTHRVKLTEHGKPNYFHIVEGDQ